MRIGLIAPPWLPVPPPAYGGTESVIDRLARGLEHEGHDVLLGAASNSTCPVTRVAGTDEAPSGAPIVCDSITELSHVIRCYSAMTDVDIVHDHTLVGPHCSRLYGSISVVTTNHGPFDATHNALYRSLDHVSIVAISHDQASTATGIPIAAVIHHGIDVAAVPVGRGDGGYAAFLGRMCPDKGPREAALVARAAGVPLRMAAKLREPDERDYFAAAVKPLLCSDVEYVGELDAHDKFVLLGESFALLHPLQWAEPFGLVVIEALATGTPVVTRPLGSAPELVEEGVTGFLRSGREALAAALLDAPGLNRAACRAAASRRFDTGRMVTDHLRVYEAIVRADDGGMGPNQVRCSRPARAP
jgi:glycosyltransferase involved in cell wall biosynthesis